MSETLDGVAAEIRACTLCRLSSSRNQAVPGEGRTDADLLFIGEAPGWSENQQGRPFVGAAGKLLEELLASINLTREQVFITNIVKCWPPGNRDPQTDEIACCLDYLRRQVDIIDPKIIVTLGRHSMARFFRGAKISKIHGTTIDYNGRKVFAMYHPAAALHQASLRQTLFDDMETIPAILEGITITAKPPQEEQLSLF